MTQSTLLQALPRPLLPGLLALLLGLLVLALVLLLLGLVLVQLFLGLLRGCCCCCDWGCWLCDWHWAHSRGGGAAGSGGAGGVPGACRGAEQMGPCVQDVRQGVHRRARRPAPRRGCATSCAPRGCFVTYLSKTSLSFLRQASGIPW